MATSFTTYTQVNNLDEFAMIAGSTYTLTFTVYQDDALVNLLDLTGATIKWTLSPYGDTSFRTLLKTGVVVSAGTFTVTLLPADTISLSGKYLQQPVITDFSGKVFRPSQGTVLISPQISAT